MAVVQLKYNERARSRGAAPRARTGPALPCRRRLIIYIIYNPLVAPMARCEKRVAGTIVAGSPHAGGARVVS